VCTYTSQKTTSSATDHVNASDVKRHGKIGRPGSPMPSTRATPGYYYYYSVGTAPFSLPLPSKTERSVSLAWM
jgi:hypothetical protein